MQTRLAAAVSAALVLGLAVFAGAAVAGNGNSGSGSGSHGNSGQSQQQAPQQQQQQPQQQQQQQQQQSEQPSSSQDQQHGQSSHDAQPGSAQSNHGQSNHGQSGHDQSQPQQQQPSGSQGSGNQTGVKPSNTTQHDTHASASSSQTKQYGNGQTAGEIATKAGQGNATLHGPGNSQPHKTACGSHEVDVHALKAHGSDCGASMPTQVQQQREHQPSSQSHEQSKPQTEQPKTVRPAVVEHPATPAPAEQHVTICHATGSSSHPYVEISPSASGVVNGHLGHQGGRDIVPPFVYQGHTYSENWDASGQAIFAAGCTVSAPAPAAAGAAVTPAASPAAASPAPTAAAASAPAAVAAGTVATPAAPASAGGVKGVTATLHPASTRHATAPEAATKPRKSAGGVLGTTTRLGKSVSGSRLPFTGLALWIFVLVAAVLVGLGATLRRTGAGRRL